MLAQIALIGCSAVIFVLGFIHLVYTFRSQKFSPREPGLEEKLKSSLLVLTRETTFWKAWIGFNASHSLGALFFGAIYGYFATVQIELFRESYFLKALGTVVLISYYALARRYWFKIPRRGIALALVLFIAAAFL
jgi:hypothetical protein